MLHFAYDGSINGDWVSHYAVQLASAQHDRTLRLIHFRGGQILPTILEDKLGRIRRECEHQRVRLIEEIRPPAERDLETAIRSAVPAGPEHFLLCGVPARALGHGALRETIAGRLLRSGHCNVLAVRVVHPGLLGSPHRLLIPVTERTDGFRSGMQFLRLFAPQVTRLHIVLIARVGRRRFLRMSHEGAERLLAPGQAYCERVEREIVEQLGLGSDAMDAQVVVSDQVAREILIAAHRTKSRLVYLGVSERHPAERFLHGDPVEQILRDASCDVAIYRGAA
jgi:nucleotide-binding universal stress UspA family protein